MESANAVGVSLFVAIRQFSDPESWTELEQLLGLNRGTEEREDWTEEDWARRDYQVMLKLEVARKRPTEGLTALHHWTQLTTGIKAGLRSGELVATGYVKPVKMADERTAIPPDKWRFLKPDFRDSTASGAGMEIVSILVRRADQLDQAPSYTAYPYRTGLPGKRSIKHLIVQEFRCRVESGGYELTLKAEAQALHEWAKGKHPEAPTPTPKVIENHIRDNYSRLVRNKPTK